MEAAVAMSFEHEETEGTESQLRRAVASVSSCSNQQSDQPYLPTISHPGITFLSSAAPAAVTCVPIKSSSDNLASPCSDGRPASVTSQYGRYSDSMPRRSLKCARPASPMPVPLSANVF